MNRKEGVNNLQGCVQKIHGGMSIKDTRVNCWLMFVLIFPVMVVNSNVLDKPGHAWDCIDAK